MVENSLFFTSNEKITLIFAENGLHPDEGLYKLVTWDFWRSFVDFDGETQDGITLKKVWKLSN